MTVLQLVLGGSGTGLKPVPNPLQLPPEEFLGDGAFLAGSDDLIRIAAHLAMHGFRILSFSFVDRYFEPIEESRNNELSDELRSIIQRGITPETRSRFVREKLAGLNIGLVRFRNLETHGNVAIAQEGIVRTRSEADLPSLVSGLSGLPRQ